MNIATLLRVTVVALVLVAGPSNGGDTSLRFERGEGGSFTFDTGVLRGVLREEGRSNGLLPVTYIADGSSISAGEGFFNHYRVFTRGVRYGYGARRWPSSARLRDDGSVEVIWPSTADRPFVLKSSYTWASPDTVDVVTTVHAESELEAFEVFLASYYPAGFSESRVWGSRDPRGGEKEGFVSADRELGEWLAFPRDADSAAVIDDGRWELGSSPLQWTMMPAFVLPVAVRRDPGSGLAVISMARPEGCFGVFTPYGEEKHFSNYFSLFGQDVGTGETVIAKVRLVVLPDPTDAEIFELANDYLRAKD